MQGLLDKLNPEQHKAVVTTEGPVLILAGAGSGKTRVLTHRIAYLVSEKSVHPESILAVTFTNKAAGEMKERVRHILGASASRVWVSTFHSMCVRILRRDIGRIGFNNNFVIYDERDRLGVIKSVMERLGINEKLFSPTAIAGRIDQAKNHLLNASGYTALARDFFAERAAKVYAGYEEEMRKSNALDFGDLIMQTVRLFNEDSGILSMYQDKFRYVMVDEYQDTNHAQYKLIHLLTSLHGNICVVGDDDQSVYGWRGADISNILDFEKDYKNAAVIRLEQNYRSTKNIINAAASLIHRNTGRKGKTLWTDNPQGDLISRHTASDEHEEASFITRETKRLRAEDDLAYGDFAVFYRTNAQSRVIEDILMRDGIPYTIVGGLRFYDRAEIKDILAYLKIIANSSDSISVKRVINVPARGIGTTTVEKLEACSACSGRDILSSIEALTEAPTEDVLKPFHEAISKGARVKLRSFNDMIKKLSTAAVSLTIAKLVEMILAEIQYVEKLREEKTEEALGRIENIEEFMTVAREFDEIAEDKSLRAFLDQVALVSDVDDSKEVSDRLTLMTLHAAKGLEFPVVFISGMENGLFPHSRTMDDPAGLEEERRLCYVGMTRAKRKLYLLNARLRRVFGREQINAASMFLEEVPKELIETVGKFNRADNSGFTERNFSDRPPTHYPSGAVFEQPSGGANFNIHVSSDDGHAYTDETLFLKKGSRVRHSTLGIGIIKGSEGEGISKKVTVQFNGGIKKLLLRAAGLELV